MGEAAPCLMRSVSQPLFASCEYKEGQGDPLRALTTSISFGRFMTEPLDWEKWSSFSHNRTLEDVQKHSRPGAVAEKKAFFEAHYKKIASKKTTKSPQKENKPPNHSPQTTISPTISNTHSPIDETRENESVLSQIDEHTTGTIQVEHDISSSKDVCSPSTNLVPSQFGNSDDDVASNGQVEHGKESAENVTSEKHRFDGDVASNGQVEQGKESTENVTSEKHRFDDDVASNGQVEQGKESTENVTSEKHRFDDDVASNGQVEVSTENVSSKKRGLYQSSHVDKIKKTQMKDAKTGHTKPKSCQKAPTLPINHKKVTTDVTEKKRSALKSLHMSINFLPTRNKNETSKTTTTKPKDRLIQIQQPLNLKASINGVKKNPQVPQNASSVCTKKPRFSSSSSSTVPSSFSFRSEERAAKRKEFFQKLEEKCNTKETEKIHLQPKLKTRNDNQKLALDTKKPCTNETKSPKVGRKSTLRSIQESFCQSPWRTSSKPKNFIEINKKKLTTSMASLPTKKILHDSSKKY
ncbi:hypothetical protein L1887_33086 [Cichorium endivia]|nr:hypothetical protein L1887_33086 [Cichorium endivia]